MVQVVFKKCKSIPLGVLQICHQDWRGGAVVAWQANKGGVHLLTLCGDVGGTAGEQQWHVVSDVGRCGGPGQTKGDLLSAFYHLPG